MKAYGMSAPSVFWCVWIVCHVISVSVAVGPEPCPGVTEISEMTNTLARKLDAIHNTIVALGDRLTMAIVDKRQQDSVCRTSINSILQDLFRSPVIEQYKTALQTWAEEYKTWKTTVTRDIFVNSDWRLVFMATAGNGQKVFDAWTLGKGTTSYKPTSTKRSCSVHYRDPAVSNWAALNATYVRYVLYENEREVAYVEFNGTGSSSLSWFARDRILSSSWCDLTATGSFNHFSISGHVEATLDRRFIVNSVYGGCPNDKGHLITIDTASPRCALDNQPSVPQFLYSKISSVDSWDRQMFGRADYLAIYIKTSF